MSTYLEELTLAMSRTQEHGLKVPSFHAEPTRRWLTKTVIDQIARLLFSEFPGITIEDLSAKCLSVNKRMLPAVSKLFGCEVLYTLGRLEGKAIGGGYYKDFDDKFISDKLESKHHEESIDVHAWLTLPSLELIDLTIFTTIGNKKNIPDLCGNLLMRHVDELTDMSYIPVLVGDHFLIKAGVQF